MYSTDVRQVSSDTDGRIDGDMRTRQNKIVGGAACIAAFTMNVAAKASSCETTMANTVAMLSSNSAISKLPIVGSGASVRIGVRAAFDGLVWNAATEGQR